MPLAIGCACQYEKALARLSWHKPSAFSSHLVLGCRGQDVQNVDSTLDDSVCSPIRVLVPTIRRTDLDAAGKSSLDLVDLGQEFRAGKVAPIERLRADRDGIDLSLILSRVLLDGLRVRL